MLISKKIENAINNFDFEKVEEVMKFLDWRWVIYREYAVPTIDQMKQTVRSLAESTVARYFEDNPPNKPFYYTRTGGFCVTIFTVDGIPEVSIDFELEKHLLFNKI